MKKLKKIVAIVIATSFVLVASAISVFAVGFSYDVTGGTFSGSLSGNNYGASAWTTYTATNGMCAVELFEVYTDGSYGYLSGAVGDDYAGTSSNSSGSPNIDFLGSDHHYGQNGIWLGVDTLDLQ